MTAVKKEVAKNIVAKKPVAKKPAAKKLVEKAAPKKVPVKKTPEKKATEKLPLSTSVKESREDHFNLIQKEAYFLAEKDGFAGDPLCYWIEAEVKVRVAVRSSGK